MKEGREQEIDEVRLKRGSEEGRKRERGKRVLEGAS